MLALWRTWAEDARASLQSDPSRASLRHVWLFSAGFHALAAHRLAHGLWQRGWGFPALVIAHVTRAITGVEIHPGARVGRRVVIDHGMGVVIGETAVVGDDCLLFHGVTLGASRTVDGRRHPTLGARCVIGAGASILGALSIGENCRIGAGAVVVRDVDPGRTVVGWTARPLPVRRAADVEGRLTELEECAQEVGSSPSQFELGAGI